MADVFATHHWQHPAGEPTEGRPAAEVARWISPQLFSLLAGELFVLCLLVGLYTVLRVSHPEIERSTLRFPHWGWGAAQLAVVALAWLNARFIPGQMQGASRATAMILAAVTAMYGLAGLGLKGLEWTRWSSSQIILVPTAGATVASVAATAAPAADPQLGAKAFAGTCAACHGSGAQGISPLAPALKGSEFMTSASDAEVTSVIVSGRTANNPASKTGKMMPPRGGNPFLSDTDVHNIMAFLRELSGAAGATNPATVAAEAPRWVVPLPPAGPQGLSAGFQPPTEQPWIPADLLAQQPNAQEAAFAPLAGLMGGLQAIHLLIGIAVMTGVIWQAYAAPLTDSSQLARFGRLYWAGGIAMWLILYPLLYLI